MLKRTLLAGATALTFTTAGFATDFTAGVDAGKFKRFKDMGDGTHAETMFLGAPPGLATDQISVGVTATPIVAARTGRQAVTIYNWGAADVFVGIASVTANTGAKIPALNSRTFNSSAALFGITAAGNATVDYAETF